MPYFFIDLLPLLLMLFECGLGYDPLGEPILHQTGCQNKSQDRDNDLIIECRLPGNFIFGPNSLPTEVSELKILQGGDVQFDAHSFSKISRLKQITISNVNNFTMSAESFLNLSSQLRLEITDVSTVDIQSRALYLLRKAIHMLINRCATVIIGMDAIPWIEDLSINTVSNLELKVDTTRKLQADKNHMPQTRNVNFTSVGVKELPANSFPSSTKTITISACNIPAFRRNSVSSMDGENIYITDSTIGVIEIEAFKPNSHFKGLVLLKKVTVRKIESGAIHSAFTNFTVIDSKIDWIDQQAFNITRMNNVLFDNNTFLSIESGGLEIALGSHKIVTFTRNTFKNLPTHAIKVQNEEKSPNASKFVFKNNNFDELKTHSLVFKPLETIPFHVKENIFLNACACDLQEKIKTYIDSDDNLIDAMYNDSYCTLPPGFSKCFNHSDDFMKTTEWVGRMCNTSLEMKCPGKVNPNSDKANEKKLMNEKAVIFIVILVASAGILLTMVLIACLWFGRHKNTSRECHFSNFGHHLRSYLTHFMPSNPMVRSRSSTSITRVPVHDYAEVLPPKYVDIDDDTYICIDKATQTLPEELTQELLQTLRDKLDDPENYREARCMIEHLYDLIKVEESCNHNLLSEDVLADLSPDEGVDIQTDTNENLYDTIGLDVLQQRRRRKSRSSRKLVHRGTRTPSLDKLTPQSYTNTSYSNSMRSRKSAPSLTLPRPSVTEYMQPVDQHSPSYNESLYDYASILSTLDIADSRSTNSTASTRKLTAAYSVGPQILTDYKDPCDLKVPIYSQLDEMMQRPLPLTPLAEQVNNDLGDLYGTRL